MMIGIIAASEVELQSIKDRVNITQTINKAMLSFHQGRYNDIDVVLVYSGVCKVNAAIATQVMLSLFNIDEVVMVGVAGGLDKRLNLYDVVISSRLAYHDVADDILVEYHPWMSENYFKVDQRILSKFAPIIKKYNHVYEGLIVTGEHFIETEGREDIVQRFKPLAVDMESASVAHVCYANSTPFVAIRAISDTDDKRGIEVFDNTVEMASIKAVELLIEYLNS